MYKLLIVLCLSFLSACQSVPLTPSSSNAFIQDRYSGEQVISVGSNLEGALKRLKAATLPKLKERFKDKNVVLYVRGYDNYVDGIYNSYPIGGLNTNPVPSHNALKVFSGSGFKIISKGCPRKNLPEGLSLQIKTSVVAYDERVHFHRKGWEITGDSSSSTGVHDTSNWRSEDNLVLATEVIQCDDGEVIDTDYFPLSLVSANSAYSLLFFNKLAGLFYNDSESITAKPQQMRDNVSLYSMMKISAGLSDLSESEYELALYGFSTSYNMQTGMLSTHFSDTSFDSSQANFLITSEYFGQSKAETVIIPFGQQIELKLRNNGASPSIDSGVKRLNIKLQYHQEIVYQKSII